MEQKPNMILLNIFGFISKMVYLNLLFLSTIILFLFTAWKVGFDHIFNYPIIILLTFIVLPPALIALVRSTYNWVENDQVSAKSFYKSFLRGFSKDSVVIYILLLLPLGLILNQVIVKAMPLFAYVVPFYYLLSFLAIIMLPFAVTECAFFESSLNAKFKNVLILALTHPGILIGDIIYGLFITIVLYQFPASLLIFAFSLYFYLFIKFYGELLSNRIEEARNQEK